MKLLDIGCGPGEIVTISYYKNLEKNYDIFGIDFQEKNIQSIKKRYPKGSFTVANAHKIPFETSAFDAVLMRHVLEHVHKIDQVLKEVKRVGKNNAQIFIAVPHPTLEKAMMRLNPHHISVGHNHERIFTRESLEALLEKNGFIIEHIANQKWPLYVVDVVLGIAAKLLKNIKIEEQTGVYTISKSNYTRSKNTGSLYNFAAKSMGTLNALFPFLNSVIPFEIEVRAVLHK